MSDTEGIQESEFQVERVSNLGNRMSSPYSSQVGISTPPVNYAPYWDGQTD